MRCRRTYVLNNINLYYSEKYQPVKDLGIGGIVILNNVSGEKDTIVEPMVVVKVDNRYSRY